MVGLVISDNFLLTGNWQNANDGIPSIKDVTQVQFTEPINQEPVIPKEF